MGNRLKCSRSITEACIKRYSKNGIFLEPRTNREPTTGKPRTCQTTDLPPINSTDHRQTDKSKIDERFLDRSKNELLKNVDMVKIKKKTFQKLHLIKKK